VCVCVYELKHMCKSPPCLQQLDWKTHGIGEHPRTMPALVFCRRFYQENAQLHYQEATLVARARALQVPLHPFAWEMHMLACVRAD